MKYEITRHNEVGQADHGWLKAKHYFSFASYYNPSKMGFGRLRVINDDVVRAGTGFGTHPHRDMEIITIPQAGAVSHKDSTGNEGTIRKGEIQVMSAGTGVLHSEFNHSKNEDLNLFQIWIEPNKKGVKPRYDQRQFAFQDKVNEWTQLVSPMENPKEDGVKIYQNAFINVTTLKAGKTLQYKLKHSGHGLYLLLSKGEIEVTGQKLISRDAIALSEFKELDLKADVDSELIAIEVPLT